MFAGPPDLHPCGLARSSRRVRDADAPRMRQARPRLCSLRRRDDGFSLLESVIALAIAASVFIAMGAAAMTAVRGTTLARTNQQVGDFLQQRLEEIRLLDYASLANRADDMTGDTWVVTCGSTKCVQPVGGANEPLVLDPVGAVYPHVTQPTAAQANNSDITLYTYVSRPTDSYGAAYKRVTVRAVWRAYGQTNEKAISTIVTESQRGLPLPVFKFAVKTATTVSVNPGTQVVYGLQVNNLGARDRFSLVDDDSIGWSYYTDVNNNLVYDSATDTPLTDTNADGILDTGLLEPATVRNILAVHTVPDATATASSTTTTWTATSVAQAAATGAVQSATTVTNVVLSVITPSPTSTPTATPTAPATDCVAPSGAPTATSGYVHYLKNANGSVGSGTDTTAQDLLYMTRTAPTPASLKKYSTNLSTEPGRLLKPTSSGWSTTGADKVANWRYQATANNTTFSGTGVVTVYAASAAPTATTDMQLRAYVYTYRKSGASWVTAQVGSPLELTIANPTFSCAGFQQLSASVTLPATTISNNDYLGLRIVNAGSQDVRIAYDVASVYQSTFIVPANK